MSIESPTSTQLPDLSASPSTHTDSTEANHANPPEADQAAVPAGSARPRERRPAHDRDGAFFRDPSHDRRTISRPAVIALIDADFWRWWQDTPKAQPEREVVIAARQWVRDALAQARDGLYLQRIVWVGESRVPGLDDIRVIPVHNPDDDEGWPPVRALSQALFDIAQGGIVHTVLLATDDDRLLPAIDEVQRRGLRVLMLQGDERKLSDEWRRLLRSADRCLPSGDGRGHRNSAARDSAYRETTGPNDRDLGERDRRDRDRSDRDRGDRDRMGLGDDVAAEPPTPEILQTLNEAAGQWWSALDDAARQSLREALPHSRGLPRDLDRQLLISAARSLDRQLSVPEKHALRGAARATATAGAGTGSLSGTGSADAPGRPLDSVASDLSG